MMNDEMKMVAKTMLNEGCSPEHTMEVVFDNGYYLYPNCHTLSDIAKAMYSDEMHIIERLDMANYVSVDWDRLAEDLNIDRGMYISESGYGIVEVV